jgi:hypothetical protein
MCTACKMHRPRPVHFDQTDQTTTHALTDCGHTNTRTRHVNVRASMLRLSSWWPRACVTNLRPRTAGKHIRQGEQPEERATCMQALSTTR